MKQLLVFLAFLLIAIPSAFSQISAAVSVDENGNLSYPLNGSIFITNNNAEIRLSGTGSVLRLTNTSTNGILTADDVVVRDYLVVSNTFTNAGTATFLTNATIGGSLTVTNIATLRSNTTVGGTFTVTNTATLLSNVIVGNTLTVTNTATFNTNVNVSGNLTNAGSIFINTATTAAAATNVAVTKSYVDNIPLFLTYDSTGVANETTSISNYLTLVAPPADYPTGKVARVLAVSNSYALAVTNNTANFMTGFNVTLTTGTGTFLTTGTSLSVTYSTNLNAVRFNTTPAGNIVPTNNVNASVFTSIEASSISLNQGSSSALTSVGINTLTTNATTAVTNVSVGITVTTTRKLFTFVDGGTAWGTPTITNQ